MNLTLRDKIKGAIVGFALGDALGVGTEFMTRGEVEAYYPDGLKEFKQIIRDAHRSQWEPGESTTDTLIFTTILEQFLKDGRINILSCAKAIKDVVYNAEADMNPVYRIVMSEKKWEKRPIVSCHDTWMKNKSLDPTCDAMQRGIVAALISSKNDLDQNTRTLVQLTHDESRCISSALVLAHCAYALLHNDEVLSYEDLEGLAMVHDSRLIPYIQAARDKNLDELKLDEEESMSDTLKCLSGALWSLWHCNNPEDTLFTLANSGGDADSNAAISTALAGLRFGVDALPQLKNKLKDIDYLIDLANRLADATN